MLTGCGSNYHYPIAGVRAGLPSVAAVNAGVYVPVHDGPGRMHGGIVANAEAGLMAGRLDLGYGTVSSSMQFGPGLAWRVGPSLMRTWWAPPFVPADVTWMGLRAGASMMVFQGSVGVYAAEWGTDWPLTVTFDVGLGWGG